MVTFSQRNEYDMEKEKKIAIKSMKKLNFILIQILRILSFCLSFELLIVLSIQFTQRSVTRVFCFQPFNNNNNYNNYY